MFMTSLRASKKSKMSFREALAVRTKSEAPADGHGWIMTFHSSVVKIVKRAASVRLQAPAIFFV